MAGDWIKMRADLFTYPKFLRLAGLIWSSEKGSQAEYVTRDFDCEGVTERASHDVTFASLFRVWCAVNTHCKVRGMDACCPGLSLMDLDPLAGYDGFGEAMRAAGLVVEDGQGGLLFPNFLEFNEPACLRSPPRTGQQRVAECRARKKANALKQDVTDCSAVKPPVTPCNGREEIEIEEDKKEKNTPLPPRGGVEKSSVTSIRNGKKTEEPPGFSRFWQAYPRKEDKAKAAEAFAKLDPPDGLLEVMLAAIERQKVSGCLEPRAADGRCVIPYAVRWLRNRRWEDEPPPAPPKSNSSAGGGFAAAFRAALGEMP